VCIEVLYGDVLSRRRFVCAPIIRMLNLITKIENFVYLSGVVEKRLRKEISKRRVKISFN
jgi:hypothetical protein